MPTTEVELEQMVEARVTARAQADAWRWRLRLIVIETVMLGSLVGSAGFAMGQASGVVWRSALLVAAACFISGSLLIGLTGAASWLSAWLWRYVMRWRKV